MPTNDPSPDADPLRILVAWRPDADGTEALEFAAWLARTTIVQVRVVMTYVRIWPTSSRNKTSSKYKKWHRHQSERYAKKVTSALQEAGLDDEPHVSRIDFFTTLAGYVHWRLTGRRVLGVGDASGMFPIDSQTRDYDADLLVLGTNATAPKGRFRAGSTAETLLHSSPHPVALTPRAVKLSKRGVTRINMAFLESDYTQHTQLLHFAAQLADRWGVPLRLVAFSPMGLTKTSDKISADIARTISDEWHEQALGMLDRARDSVMENVPDLDVSTAIGAGSGWGGAVDALKWKKGDLICLDSVERGPIERVFIGSTEAEFLRHVQAPVLLNPAPRR